MSGGLSFNSVLLVCEEESDEGDAVTDDWVGTDGWVRSAPDV